MHGNTYLRFFFCTRLTKKKTGAALAPQWEFIWSENSYISPDASSNIFNQQIDEKINEYILKALEEEIIDKKSANEKIDMVALKKKALHRMPTNKNVSRLSNLVIQAEHRG